MNTTQTAIAQVITFKFLKNLSSDTVDSVKELDEKQFYDAINGKPSCFEGIEDNLTLIAWTNFDAWNDSQRAFHIIVSSESRLPYSQELADEKITQYEFKAAMFKKHDGKWTVHTKVGAKIGELVFVQRRDGTFALVRLTEIVSKKRDGSFLMNFEELAK